MGKRQLPHGFQVVRAELTLYPTQTLKPLVNPNRVGLRRVVGRDVQLVIAFQDRATERPHQLPTRLRVGQDVDRVTCNNGLVHARLRDVRQHRLQSAEVAVNIGDNGYPHEMATFGIAASILFTGFKVSA